MKNKKLFLLGAFLLSFFSINGPSTRFFAKK